MKSILDIQDWLEEPVRQRIIRELDSLEFSMVKTLPTKQQREELREALEAFFADRLTYDELSVRIAQLRPFDPRKPNTSALTLARRIARTEVSRAHTIGFLEYLKDQDETECYVPCSPDESSSECLQTIVGRTFPIHQLLQDARSYSKPMVPLHPNCTHVVTRVPTSY